MNLLSIDAVNNIHKYNDGKHNNLPLEEIINTKINNYHYLSWLFGNMGYCQIFWEGSEGQWDDKVDITEFISVSSTQKSKHHVKNK